ncbi:MAG: hypothetical protein CMI18_01515 [Opitutaceae bacterium]|nr:hypothetical protein [Opitutaceae bacterium]
MNPFISALSAEYNITNFKCEDKPACALLLKLLVFEIESSLSEFSHVQTNAYHTFCECRKFLESNFLELNSASEIAIAMQLDQTYLTRFFSKIDGENPYKEFIRLKMDQVVRLFPNKNVSVRDVVASVGFKDPAHFSWVLRMHLGYHQGRPKSPCHLLLSSLNSEESTVFSKDGFRKVVISDLEPDQGPLKAGAFFSNPA